jgi:alkylresorcinol/alkylpyrone synthase
MLTANPEEAPRHRAPGTLNVELLSVATAVPAHRIDQREAAARAKRVFPVLARLYGIYENAGIETRYSCVEPDWCHKPHGWEERTEIFLRHALDLLEKVALEACRRAGLHPADIDVLAVNTITGLAIPSLDALLCNRLPFRADVERLPIFGLGCGGGVGGMALAARLAQGRPGANVLFVTVDLCTLSARPNDKSMGMFVSAALFGDGAAGVILRAPAGRTAPGSAGIGAIRAAGTHFWPGTERIMGWDIKSDGFGVVLSPALPGLLRERLPGAVETFLQASGIDAGSVDGFLFHPGGRKILETVEEVLAAPREALRHSWEVLRAYGNMSSATALFVLDQAVRAGVRGRQLIAAFGPGFSAYFILAEFQ